MYNTQIDKDMFLQKLCSEIKYKKIRPAIADEYDNHIAELADDLINDGYEPEAAYLSAVERMGNPAEIGRELNKTHKPLIEWSVVLLTAALIIVGITVLRQVNKLDQYPFFNTGTLASSTVLGIIVLVCMMFFDYKKLEKLSFPAFIIISAVLIIICVYGSGYYNYKNIYISWQIIHNIPTIIIPVLIICFAGAVKRLCSGKLSDFFIMLILSAMPLVALFMYPSFTYVIILGVIFISMITYGVLAPEFSGNKRKYLTRLYGGGVVAVLCLIGWIAWRFPYIGERLKTMVYPEPEYGAGFHSRMARLFISSSKPIGQTVITAGGRTMTITDVISGIHTDYIFTAITATYGWIFAIALLLLFAVFLWRIVVSSRKIKDYYGRMLAVGICAAFVFQITVNVLVSVGVLPFVSVNLPFISYGGTGFVCNMALVGLLLNVYRRKDIILKRSILCLK